MYIRKLELSENILVMDNARIHKTSEVVRTFGSVGLNHQFLPLYSPQLNPIEQWFSTRVPRNLMVPPIQSRGSAIQNLVQRINNILNSFSKIYFIIYMHILKKFIF